MSTRATYLLPAAYHSDQMVCFYIHHDGYPEGAADYFYEMHHCNNTRGGMAGRFFRANLNAEFTKDHEEHGDTEFRYTINHQDELSVWKKGMLGNQWNIIYQGSWHHFVNKYLEESEHLHLFRLSKGLQNEILMTIHQAEKLFISPKTLNASRYSIYKKLNIKTDVELMILANQTGLMEL